jgi:hypothetical protein
MVIGRGCGIRNHCVKVGQCYLDNQHQFRSVIREIMSLVMQAERMQEICLAVFRQYVAKKW